MNITPENGHEIREASVLHLEGDIVHVSSEHVNTLKGMAKNTPLRRARLCAHRNVDEPVHEMIIVLQKDSLILPHMHPNKMESFHVIEGKLAVVIFDGTGKIIETIFMSDYASGESFFYRLPAGRYHTVIPLTDPVVFHETTQGPFERDGGVMAPFCPGPHHGDSGRTYMEKLVETVGLIYGEKSND